MQSKYPTLYKIDRAYIRLSEILAIIAGVIMMILCVILFADVVGFRLFNRNIPHTNEMVTNFHVPVVYLTLLAVQLGDGHANVELVYAHFPYIVKRICFILWDVLGVVVCGLETYVAFGYTVERFQLGELSGITSGFPIWPFAASMCLGWCLMGLGYIWSIIRTLSGFKEIPHANRSEVPENLNGKEEIQ